VLTPPSDTGAMSEKTTLTDTEVADQAPPAFRHLHGSIQARFRTGDFRTGLALVDRIGAVAEERNHHPDLDLRYGYVDVRLVSHDAGGITGRDIDLARTVTEIAAEVGATPDPDGLVAEVEGGAQRD